MDKQLEQGNGINLGSRNVRTLNTPGALQYVLDTVRSYKIQLLALQEVRWPNKGSVTKENMTLFYSGTDNGARENGVDIPQKYIDLIKMCKTNLKIKYQQEISEKFEVKSGLRQGDALSPMSFNIALEWVVRTANETRKMEVGKIETILAYADDVVILGNCRNEVKQTTINFLEAGKIMGLEVNEEKTKYMYISRNDRNDLNLKVDLYVFEKVEAFKYLGININSKNNVHEEIKERVVSANQCYYNLLKLFRSKLLSRESKVILYTRYLRPVLTYGCETWATTKGDYAKLCTTEKKCSEKYLAQFII
ncbi:hypothetical protein QTP88_028739 [Uroleucon formosanum]